MLGRSRTRRIVSRSRAQRLSVVTIESLEPRQVFQGESSFEVATSPSIAAQIEPTSALVAAQMSCPMVLASEADTDASGEQRSESARSAGLAEGELRVARPIVAAIAAEESPLVRDDTVDVLEQDTPRSIDVLANDPFAETYLGPRKITRIEPLNAPYYFTAYIAQDGKSVQIIPDSSPNRAGRYLASFKYTVDDQHQATMNVWVHRGAKDDHFSALSVGNVITLDVLNNDTYTSKVTGQVIPTVGTITEIPSTSSQGGRLELTADRQRVIYTPPSGRSLPDSFDYQLADRYWAHVHIDLAYPVVDDHLKVFADVPGQTIDLLANDLVTEDAGYVGEGRVSAASRTKKGGTIIVDGTQVVYTPPTGYVGLDFFQYFVDEQFSAMAYLEVAALTPLAELRVCDPLEPTALFDILSDPVWDSLTSAERRITAARIVEDSGRIPSAVYVTPNHQQISVAFGTGSQLKLEVTVGDRLTTTVNLVRNTYLADDHFTVHGNELVAKLPVLANDFVVSSVCQATLPAAAANYSGERRITIVDESARGGVVRPSSSATNLVYTPPESGAVADTIRYTVDGAMEATARIAIGPRDFDDHFWVAPGESRRLSLMANDTRPTSWTGDWRITQVGPSRADAQIELSADGRAIIYHASETFSEPDSFTYQIGDRYRARVTIAPANPDGVLRLQHLAGFAEHLGDQGVAEWSSLFGQPVGNASSDVITSFVSGNYDTARLVADPAQVGSEVIVAGRIEYVLRDNQLVTYRRTDANVLLEIDRQAINGKPYRLFDVGNRLAVVSSLLPADQSEQLVWSDSAWPESQLTLFERDADQKPRVIHQTQWEGRLVGAQLENGRLYVSATHRAAPLAPRVISTSGGAARFETEAEYLQRLRTKETRAFIERALPNFASWDERGLMTRAGYVVLPSEIEFPTDRSHSLHLLVAFDLQAASPGLVQSAAYYANRAVTHFAVDGDQVLTIDEGGTLRQFVVRAEDGAIRRHAMRTIDVGNDYLPHFVDGQLFLLVLRRDVATPTARPDVWLERYRQVADEWVEAGPVVRLDATVDAYTFRGAQLLSLRAEQVSVVALDDLTSEPVSADVAWIPGYLRETRGANEYATVPVTSSPQTNPSLQDDPTFRSFSDLPPAALAEIAAAYSTEVGGIVPVIDERRNGAREGVVSVGGQLVRFRLTDDDFELVSGPFQFGAPPVSVPANLWTNPLNHLDVNRDGQLSPLDALLVINRLKADGADELPTSALLWQIESPYNSDADFWDTNEDGFISAIDALLVINRLNENLPQ